MGQQVDVAVLGGAVAGLAAAAMLAKAGYRVLLVGSDALAAGKATSIDASLCMPQAQSAGHTNNLYANAAGPHAPCLGPSWFGAASVSVQAPAVRRVHAAVGLPLSAMQPSQRATPRQLLGPTRRVLVPSGRTALTAIAQQWPEHDLPIRQFEARLRQSARVVGDALLSPPPVPALSVFESWRALAMGNRWQQRIGGARSAFAESVFGPLQHVPDLYDMLRVPLAAAPESTPVFVAIRLLSSFWLEDELQTGPPSDPGAHLRQRALASGAQWWRQGGLHGTAARKRLEVVGENQGQRAMAGMVLFNPLRSERDLPWGVDDTLLAPAGEPPAAPWWQRMRAASGARGNGFGGIWPTAPETNSASAAAAHLRRARSASFAVRGPSRLVPEQLAPMAYVQSTGAQAWIFQRGEQPEQGEAALLTAHPLGARLQHDQAALATMLATELRRLAPAFAKQCEVEPIAASQQATAWTGDGATLGIQGAAMHTRNKRLWCTHDDVLPVLGAEGHYWLGLRAARGVGRRLGRTHLSQISRPPGSDESEPW